MIDLDGIDIAYELIGEGQPWVLTPGGRFSKDDVGVTAMAQALADEGRRVLTWDRPNCGASSVVFRGPSESEVQADALALLIDRLDLGPTVIAGGSGGARVSLLTAARHPQVAAGLAMWWISGGVPGLLQLANYYAFPSADAAWHGGIDAVLELGQWQEVLARNPANRERFQQMDRAEFLRVMDQWMLAYCPRDDTLVPGLTDDDIAHLDVPILVFRSGISDMSHTRATSETIAAGLPNAELVEPPWGDAEWNERRAEVAETGSLFVRWPLLVPQLVAWANRTIPSKAL